MWYNGYLSDFNEDFIKNYNKDSDEGYFLEVDIEQILSIPKNYGVLIKTYYFYQREKKKQRKQKNLFAVQKTKINMSFT